LEKRVLERTAELRATNAALEREIAERQRSEQALRESEAQFRRLAENINEVLWIESHDTNKLIYVSPVFEQIWGRTCAGLYDDPNSFLDSVHQDDRERFIAHLAKQRNGEFSETDYRINRPDGSIRWIRDRSFPIHNSDGKVYRSAGIGEDITARKGLEEQIRRHTEELEKLIEERNAQIVKLEQQRLEIEKLAATGRTAARLAHEIDNP
jgi:PAS domain S-box-containing protein